MPDAALPILDAESPEFIDGLREVCHRHGFFYLTGHGIDSRLNDEVHGVAGRFFALPEAQRMEIANTRSPQFRGYTPVGHEYTYGQPDQREQLDIGLELPAPQLGPDDPAWLRLRGPNLWPAALPELRPVITEWMRQMEQVGRALLRALAIALDQDPARMEPFVDPAPEVLVKVIRYPVGQDPQGVGEHRDTGLLTFVHQDDHAGLQVKIDGTWIDIPRVPGAFVVNLGEMMQLLTHGYFAATVHRVVSPPSGPPRMSVAYFFNPKLEATLAPLVLPPALAAEAPGGESTDPTNPILANYGENSLKVRLRAHPDVAQIHHPELVRQTSARAPAPMRSRKLSQ